MPRTSYGPQAKKRAKRLLEALLVYANDVSQRGDRPSIQVNCQSDTRLVISTKIRFLEELTAKDAYGGKLNGEQIKEALKPDCLTEVGGS